MLSWLARLLFVSRHDLRLQIMVFREHLDIHRRQQAGRGSSRTDEDRRFLVSLWLHWPGWGDALVIIEPDAIARCLGS